MADISTTAGIGAAAPAAQVSRYDPDDLQLDAGLSPMLDFSSGSGGAASAADTDIEEVLSLLGGRRRKGASHRPITDAAITDSIRYDLREVGGPSLAAARKLPRFKLAEAEYRALRHQWDDAFLNTRKNDCAATRRAYKALGVKVANAWDRMRAALRLRSKSRSRSHSKRR